MKRNEWPSSTIGDSCTLTSGGTPSKNNPRFWIGDVPFVSARDLKSDRIDGAFLRISREAVEQSVTKLAPVGSLLMLVRGMGLANGIQVGEVTAPVAFNQDIRAIHPPLNSLLPRFLLLALRNSFMNGERERVLSSAAHGTLKIDTDALRQIAFPLPPLAEQQRIVGLLDEAFEGLATAKPHAEKNLQHARALFESHLQSVFTQRGPGWVEKRLKSLTTKIGSEATPRGGGESYKAEGVSLIRSLNVHDMGFRYEKLAFLDDAQADGLSNVVVQRRDVLLNITGASVARCCLAPEDVLPARVNQHVSIIRPIAEKLDAKFLHYLLISKPYKDQLLATGEEGGSTRQAITKAQIQELAIEYPSDLKEQRAIVSKLDALSEETQRLATLYTRKLAALEALKKSLLHQAFTGQL